MTEVMSLVQEWMKEDPDKVRFMRTQKSLYKHRFANSARTVRLF